MSLFKMLKGVEVHMAAYTYIDVSQKQEYIYKRNKLRENLERSFIIKSVTENIRIMEREIVSLRGYLDRNFMDRFEFIYSGGGNSIVQFHTLEDAERFVQGFSREVLKAYPDLELYISLVNGSEINDIENKMAVRECLLQKADELKNRRFSRFKRWTYGVEEIDETGQAKLLADDNSGMHRVAREYLFQELKQELEGTPINVTSELQAYSKRGDGKSYIGVIAIDGNKMGEMMNKVSNFEQLRLLSENIELIYKEAVVKALRSYSESIDRYRKADEVQGEYVTPIVMSGDDICLIVDSVHAIETAADIIKSIQEISKQRMVESPELKEIIEYDYLTACAGVAIVKVTYPFFEAVKVAEGLCHHAKESIHKVKKQGGVANASFIDWEVVQGPTSSGYGHEGYVKHGAYDEIFHIKPLRIDQKAALEDQTYGYDAFIRMIGQIHYGELQISGSALNKLKKEFYSGWEPYKLFFEMNSSREQSSDQMTEYDKLAEIVRSEIGDSCYGAVVKLLDNRTRYTYVLNDIVAGLDFIRNERWEGR